MAELEVGSSPMGKVLVVDDDGPVRRVIEKILVRDGYDVVTAASGMEALAVLRSQNIDSVLLDIMMPGMNGVEVCRELRSNPATAHTPVVFLSAADDLFHRRQAREAGADDFLAKPFDEVELRARVRSSVDAKRYNDGLNRERDELQAEAKARLAALEEATETLRRVKEELEKARVETLERLTRAAEFRDDETASHLQRMSHYCRLLARKAGLDEYTAELLRMASPMHDVGKIGIPDSILLKPGKLTDAEFTIMRKHAEIGFQILSGSDSQLLELAASVAYSHHEKFDGSGYPRGLHGEAIPIEGRIAAVADVFDALTSERPYKHAWPVEEAVALLEKGRGKHFDPNLVNLFLGAMDEVLEIKAAFQD